MKILSIDTSQKSIIAGVYNDGKTDFYYDADCNLKHSDTLFDTVEQLLIKNELTLNDIDCFSAVIGPGSFTGLRIGITAVRAFAQVLDKPVVAVNTFDLKAYNIKTTGKYTAVLVDAMKNKVYYKVFDKHGNCVLDADVISEFEASMFLSQKLKCDPQEISLIYEKPLSGFGETFLPAEEGISLVKLSAERAESGKTINYNELLPEYAQVSQAEKNLNALQADKL